MGTHGVPGRLRCAVAEATRLGNREARARVPEGDALRARWDIRVAVSPDWDTASIDLTFWFACEGDVPVSAAALRVAWLRLVPALGRYAIVRGQAVTLDDLKARDWVKRDPLDFEYLSTSQPTG